MDGKLLGEYRGMARKAKGSGEVVGNNEETLAMERKVEGVAPKGETSEGSTLEASEEVSELEGGDDTQSSTGGVVLGGSFSITEKEGGSEASEENDKPLGEEEKVVEQEGPIEPKEPMEQEKLEEAKVVEEDKAVEEKVYEVGPEEVGEARVGSYRVMIVLNGMIVGKAMTAKASVGEWELGMGIIDDLTAIRKIKPFIGNGVLGGLQVVFEGHKFEGLGVSEMVIYPLGGGRLSIAKMRGSYKKVEGHWGGFEEAPSLKGMNMISNVGDSGVMLY